MASSDVPVSLQRQLLSPAHEAHAFSNSPSTSHGTNTRTSSATAVVASTPIRPEVEAFIEKQWRAYQVNKPRLFAEFHTSTKVTRLGVSIAAAAPRSCEHHGRKGERGWERGVFECARFVQAGKAACATRSAFRPHFSILHCPYCKEWLCRNCLRREIGSGIYGNGWERKQRKTRGSFYTPS